MNDDVDALFGGRTPARPSFLDRVSQGQAKPVADAEPPQEATVGSGLYKPYGFMPSNTVGEICEVRTWVNGTDVPEGLVFQYRFLMQVGFVGDEMLKLMLPDAIVVIEGKRLLDLRQKLTRRMATFIQQYNPRIWPSPPSLEPVVERIEVVRP
ncbi:hypothetical protein [Asticcacaulis sp. EMRT-3]|uniref:hypothetical protein n=1 Tax=Asticcacaulis sp. EMRT-3 TaxID=3040349 RepID=UPI0024AF1C85|nr:hypothetical protein [Asticcacaulis sp. EMRT-3]MDI7774695.1 hypothetical protein [Asticcacaulis sp. EMRT-3]